TELPLEAATDEPRLPHSWQAPARAAPVEMCSPVQGSTAAVLHSWVPACSRPDTGNDSTTADCLAPAPDDRARRPCPPFAPVGPPGPGSGAAARNGDGARRSTAIRSRHRFHRRLHARLRRRRAEEEIHRAWHGTDQEAGTHALGLHGAREEGVRLGRT